MDYEVKNMTKVGLVVAIPFSGRPVMPQWAVPFALQDYPINLYRRMTNRYGLPVAEAREQMLDEAISVGAKYLWMLDDDVQVPIKTIRRLVYQMEQHKDQGVAVTSGVYWLKNHPTEPIMFKTAGAGAFWNWKAGDVITVDEVGTGCMLIDLEQLKDMPRPWFIFTDKPSAEPQPGQPQHIMENRSEDIHFCQKVKAFGKKILVDTSIQCGHWDVETRKCYSAPEDSFPIRDERVAKALLVPGFSSYKELVWLADAAKGKKLVLELGSYQGRSTRAIADNTLGKVICFDSFTGIPTHPEDQQYDAIRKSFMQELQLFIDMGHVVLVDGDHDKPEVCVPYLEGQKPDMIFVDGDHSYVGCKRDIEFWRQHLAEGGLLCGHDASWPGVQYALEDLSKEAVIEFVEETDLWFVKAWVDSKPAKDESMAEEVTA